MRFVCSSHLRSGTSNCPSSSLGCAHLRIRVLSATVVLMKSPYEGGADESLPSKIGGLLPARGAQMTEKRTAVF